MLLVSLMVLPIIGHPQEVAPVTLKVYSAGSLKAAWQDLAAAYERKSRVKIAFEFGASGLLRERLAKGEPADLFTSPIPGIPRRWPRSAWRNRWRHSPEINYAPLRSPKSG
jgi:molybdate transport system substrate-binding protein